MTCEASPERINIFISQQDNPNLQTLSLEKLGFLPCQKDQRTHLITDWVKETYSDDIAILEQMQHCGVEKYTVSRLSDKFIGLNYQINTGHIDAITPKPCPSAPFFKDYDLNYTDEMMRIKKEAGGQK